jgi:hypothetical protein
VFPYFHEGIPSPGTDVATFKIFSPKKMAFFVPNAAIFLQKWDHNIGF